MTYTCLGNDRYEIILTVFRDCINGNPNAYFDNPASIGIFGSNNSLVSNLGMNGQLLIELMNDDTLNPVLSNPCLVVPPDVCVHTSTYRDTLELPFRAGGYQLSYQRCCRNQTIVNIVEPLASGATYGVQITEEALTSCNSSAKFQEWPPLYICVNEPIFFDQSALDTDNDSIVYRLCAPLLGASPDFPLPQPPNPPPYSTVNWISPPYGVENMLNGFNGGAVLDINSETGLLTGLPNTIGQFVVGICLEEYKDKVLISTTRRDFQYNVGICGETVSSFFTPEVVCDDELMVNFNNQSENADEFLWFFNDPLNPGASSSFANPSYQYSDTGTYTIMLVAEPGNTCVDTFFQSIRVQYPSITAAMGVNFGDCNNGATILVSDASVDIVGEPVAWEWTLTRNGQPVETSSEQHPEFFVTQSGTYRLTLNVTSVTGCTSTSVRNFSVNVVEEQLENDTLQTCPGGGINLNAVFSDDYIYEWSPAATLDDPSSPNPRATPLETTTYELTVRDSSGDCSNNLAVTVVVPPAIMLELIDDTLSCATDVTLIPQVSQGVQFIWSDDDQFDNILAETKDIVVTPFGVNTYYLLVRGPAGCIEVDSVVVNGQGVNVAVADVQLACEGEMAMLQATNLDSEDELTYQWSPAASFTSDTDIPAPTLKELPVGTHFLYLETNNQFGCSRIDTVEVGILDTMPQLSAFSNLQCSGYTIQFRNEAVNASYYIWDFGDPENPGATSNNINPVYTYPTAGDYVVKLFYDESVNCADTLFLPITVEEPQIILDFSSDFSACSDSAVIQFTDLSQNNQGTINNWEWIFDNTTTSNLQNPVFVANEAGSYTVQLIVASSDGCVDTIIRNINVPLVTESIADSLTLCPGDTVFINPGFNPDYQYAWSPETEVSDPDAPNPSISPEESTLFTVTVTAAENEVCRLEETIWVSVPPDFDLESPADQFTCGSSVTLSATASEPVEFVWSASADFSNPISLGNEISVLPDYLGTYYLRATDASGCEKTDVVSVTNNEIRVASSTTTICQGDTSQLSIINLSPVTDLVYEWSPLTNIIGSSTGNTIQINPPVTTNYTVLLENEFGCTSAQTVTANVLPGIFDLIAEATPDSVIQGKTIQLNALTDLSDITFMWEADSTLSSLIIADPVATPEADNVYTVTATDENGCTAVATVRVGVTTLDCELPFVFFPNAFSPNNDGENDFLQLYGNPVESAHWIIYNRWGEVVFETFDPQGTWDGTFKGKELSPDVYGYFLEVNCFGGEGFITKGNVTLLR